jgi:hypothetical protein
VGVRVGEWHKRERMTSVSGHLGGLCVRAACVCVCVCGGGGVFQGTTCRHVVDMWWTVNVDACNGRWASMQTHLVVRVEDTDGTLEVGNDGASLLLGVHADVARERVGAETRGHVHRLVVPGSGVC